MIKKLIQTRNSLLASLLKGRAAFWITVSSIAIFIVMATGVAIIRWQVKINATAILPYTANDQKMPNTFPPLYCHRMAVEHTLFEPPSIAKLRTCLSLPTSEHHRQQGAELDLRYSNGFRIGHDKNNTIPLEEILHTNSYSGLIWIDIKHSAAEELIRHPEKISSLSTDLATHFKTGCLIESNRLPLLLLIPTQSCRPVLRLKPKEVFGYGPWITDTQKKWLKLQKISPNAGLALSLYSHSLLNPKDLPQVPLFLFTAHAKRDFEIITKPPSNGNGNILGIVVKGLSKTND